ncbi:hypothetical protein AAFN86_03295 [Roseomonas sp. CAU 1739]|uniref:hypothetical protein n=1 Tax=Roseomonas sp. CAU 1739 TaxID=3140364 RepID=UPI00325BEA40
MRRTRWPVRAVPPSSPSTTDPAAPPDTGPGGVGRLVRRAFWAIQAVAGLGLLMVLVGLVIEESSPGSPALAILSVPIGLLPVLGPVWAIATPVLAVLMLLTRNRRRSNGDA